MHRHMTTRTRRPATLLVVAVLALSIVPGAVAAEARAGGTVIVGADETTGDLEVFAGNVRITGTVTGDVEAAGGTVHIAGTIEGNLRAAGGHVGIEEAGTVGGTLEAGAGSVAIAGTVEGNARIGADSIVLAPTGHLGGDLEYDAELDRREGARVAGTVTRNPDLSIGGPIPQVADVVFSVYFFLVNLVVGAILLLLFPRFSRRLVDRTVDRLGVTGVAGLGALVATPIGLVLVALTIIGLPLALAGLVGYGLALWIGTIYGRYVLGAWLLSLADVDNRWLGLLVGLIVVAVAVRLPVVGGLVEVAVLVWGLGALAMGLYAGYRRRRSGGAAEPATTEDEPGEAAPA
jgi:cytoskeletal protein CcmA (bactofilin family)